MLSICELPGKRGLVMFEAESILLAHALCDNNHSCWKDSSIPSVDNTCTKGTHSLLAILADN